MEIPDMTDDPKATGRKATRKKADSLPVHMTFPRETFTKLKAEAERRGMGYSTLNAQIVFDWLESRRAKSEAA
jgi:hypothetical protein